jgi:membrane protein DedA with SNARE-associated domain
MQLKCIGHPEHTASAFPITSPVRQLQGTRRTRTTSCTRCREEVQIAVVEWIELFKQVFTGFQIGNFPDLGMWSYILLGLLVATEGPLSTLIGASASAAGLLDWRLVLLATVVGNVVGDCVWYSVGYMGRMKWLYEHGRFFGMRPHHVARLEREMQLHARKLIIFAKIAYGLIVPTLVAAGMARVPWRRWFPVVFVVETLWSVILVWVGFHATAFIQEFEHALHAVGVTVLFAGVAFVLLRFLRKRIDQQELALDPLKDEANAPGYASTTIEKASVLERSPHENGASMQKSEHQDEELDEQPDEHDNSFHDEIDHKYDDEIDERRSEEQRFVALPDR